jgi:hypothetical protein
VPAKAGTQGKTCRLSDQDLDSRLRGNERRLNDRNRDVYYAAEVTGAAAGLAYCSKASMAWLAYITDGPAPM